VPPPRCDTIWYPLMPLAHVQSFVSQNSCSRPDSREPLPGSLSLDRQALDSVNTQAPPGALRRTHRLVSGNRSLTAALRRARWTAPDRRAALRQLRRAGRGAARLRQGSRSNPTPHWFPASGLRRARRRDAGEACSRAQSSLMLVVSAPSGSEEPQGHRRFA
jgi:hypothetical protein